MRSSLIRVVLLVIGACLLAASSCDHHDKPDATPPGGVADGGMCGGIAGLTCASPDSYCAMPAGSCQTPDMSGTCTPRPDICTADFNPVCGCDGNTYGNACAAAAAGINVASQGECAQQAEMCGGIAGLTCSDPGDYCNFTGGTCGAADQPGVCEPRPQVCTRDFRPVCGCDGQTYGNACGAAAAGISVVSQGACP